VPEQRRLGRQHVAARPVEQAQVDVEAAAALVLEGLGHEGGAPARVARGGLDQPLEHHGLVGRAQHVGPVAEVQLELGGRVLADRGLEGDPLRLGVAVDQREKPLVVVQPLGQEHVGLDPPPAAQPLAARDQRPAALAELGVEEVELELERGHRR
jgi:hypothetical protein